ncbi:MAG: hypothetical protein R2827_09225 [Bdellovibrionales bacterium]
MLGDIRTAWQADKDQGGYEKLVSAWQQPSSVYPEKDLWEEDMQNLQTIEQSIQQQFDTLNQDTEFLLKEGYRINKIVQSMRSLNVMKSEKRRISAKKTGRGLGDHYAGLA